MTFRDSIGATALVATLLTTVAGASAQEATKYPDWSGKSGSAARNGTGEMGSREGRRRHLWRRWNSSRFKGSGEGGGKEGPPRWRPRLRGGIPQSAKSEMSAHHECRSNIKA